MALGWGKPHGRAGDSHLKSNAPAHAAMGLPSTWCALLPTSRRIFPRLPGRPAIGGTPRGLGSI